MKYFFPSFALTSLLAIYSCKPMGSDAELSTVDNFGNANANAFTLNDCTEKNNSNIPEDIEAFLADSNRISLSDNIQLNEFHGDLAHVLMRVPLEVRKAFFQKANARIFLSNAPTNICSSIQERGGASPEVGVKESFSCWIAGDPNNEGLHFSSGSVFDKDGAVKPVSTSESIRHSLLRAMLYYVYTNATKNPGANANLLTKAKTIKALMLEGFRQDLTDHNLTDPTTGIAKEQLMEYLEIETMDSDYCTEESRGVLEKRFPKLFYAYRFGKPHPLMTK